MKRAKEDCWEQFPFKEELRNKCESCGLMGLFVREIKEGGDLND
jgi:hypothetical protein